MNDKPVNYGVSTELAEVVAKASRRNSVRNRIPQAAAERETDDTLEQIFLHGADRNLIERLDLKNKDLYELAKQYHAFGNQTQLIKGMILLEGRSRFTSKVKAQNDVEGFDKIKYGQWIKEQELDVDSAQSRDNFINIAIFFGTHRSMDKIVTSAAYALARPKYAKVAEQVYEEVKGKSMYLNDVIKLLDTREYERKHGKSFTSKKFERPAIDITPKATADQRVSNQTTINGGFENAQSIQIGNVTTLQNSTLSQLMPLDILKMSSNFKSDERREDTHGRTQEGAETLYGEGEIVAIEEDSPVYSLKESMTEEEKVWQVKELINILAKGKSEASNIADTVADYFNKVLFNEN